MYFAAAVSLAAGLVAGEGAHDSFVHLPVSRLASRPDADAFPGQALSRRDAGLTVPLANNRTLYTGDYYTIDLALGTPPQQMSLALFTDYSATVVFNEIACARVTCPGGSLFSEDASSTYLTNGTSFSDILLESIDGFSSATGNWAEDTLQLGGRNITSFKFAVANRSSANEGVVGLAPAVGERDYVAGRINTPYPNLPQQLKEQGLIQQAAFSLWLNNEGTGAVLFGGIDHAKFTTDLYRLPLLPTNDNSTVTQFAVQLKGLSIYDGDGNEQPFATCDMPVLLNTGYAISALPLDLIQPFFEMLGVIEYDSYTYVVPCDALSSADGGLGLHLGSGLDVTVGFSDLFTRLGATDGNGVEYCVPGFLPTQNWPAVLGENVLRTLYVVYDLENLEVGIAPAQTGHAASSSSSLQALSTGIPGPLISNVLNSTGGEDYDFATRSVTFAMPTRVPGESSRVSTWPFVSRTFTFESEVTRLSSLEEIPLSTWGYTHVSWTAPASVTQSVVIGAKSGALSTKGATPRSNTTSAASVVASGARADTASGTNAERPSAASASASSSAAGSEAASAPTAASGASSPATGASQSQDYAARPATGSSGAATRPAAPPSSSPVQASPEGGRGGAASSTAGASVTRASALLAALAATIFTLL